MTLIGKKLIILIILVNLIIVCVPSDSVVSGGILPDFDLEIDESIIYISPNTGIGQGTITITNVAIDASIRVRITVFPPPGMQASPESATVTVNPASTKTIPLAVAVSLGSPARIDSVLVFAEITHVNGSPASGVKERDTSAAVIIQRSHYLVF